MEENKDNNKDIQWITVNGKHIPIKPGESKRDAISKAFSEDRDGWDDDDNEEEYNALMKKASEETARVNTGQQKEVKGQDTDIESKEENKPLHIKSLEEQTSHNPDYKAIADSLSNNDDINEAYFYAFKDAYEKHGYKPSDRDITSELSDRYWSLADSYRDSRGMSDDEWDRYGISDFEENYGTEDDFINKGIEAHNKHINETNKSDEYKSKYKSEDYEDARYYPVTEEDKKAAGPKYLGRYHSIYDAAGLNDNEPGSWKKEKEMFKYVGDSETGASIVQGPDGYFSGNPRINSMSFKTLEQAKDYLDRKNPEEHKYGVYFKPGDEREYMYRDAEDKYDLEAPDAYRNAREAAKIKPQQSEDNIDVNNLKKERDILWDKMPDVTKEELQRLVDIRNKLGDEFYNKIEESEDSKKSKLHGGYVKDNGDGTYSYNGQTFPDLESLVSVYGEDVKKYIR